MIRSLGLNQNRQSAALSRPPRACENEPISAGARHTNPNTTYSADSPTTRSRLVTPLFCVGLYLLLTVASLWRLLALTRGHFTYALDDAYIHLALARNLVHGTYGINPGEFTTPSSSILWPLLLSMGASASWSQWLPFLWNVLFGILAAWMLGRIVDLWSWQEEGTFSSLKRYLTAALLILAANLLGLTFIGMEHTLQVLLAIACAYGVSEALRDRPVPLWCCVAAVLGPAVRYENFAVALPLLIALILQQRAKLATLCGVASLLAPVAFGLTLLAHGHAPLPNSVLVKANVRNAAGPTSLHLLTNVAFNVQMAPRNWPYLVLLVASAFVAARSRGSRAVLLWSTFSALLLQLLIGRFGWFHRYEVYAVIFGSCVVFSALCALRVRWVYAFAGLFLVSLPYVNAALDVPFAALDIYRQQSQVARFLSDYYKKDVAVNDLGLAAWHRAPGVYILDLIGLASDESRAVGPRDAPALEAIARRHQVGLAVVYPQYFKIPSSWYLIGLLSEPRGANVVSAFPTIGFYVTPDGNVPEVRQELTDFSATLPGGDTLAIRDPNDQVPAAQN